ncbi:exopolysaccharide biosynthesis polyprenyl glycosylphosphotransferase [Streptomyces spiramenti]|uniref:Exopolysaccharide biosynthesis polyprenyl glycosylphosphotransferase n=1 Tax=Streptomyces spiramenti TaxID=2720606 RepID=A0ABX1AT24_9ACTN|nr:exopolysaccharide biosynthesis polyprenyl glycosylphosphotransferase [Streptomyces spiramenti]NJP67437.1 exopolysaccharide biosynthesis polyprenyl glycosylphosphotransferase [Streptomyces spiramenti]
MSRHAPGDKPSLAAARPQHPGGTKPAWYAPLTVGVDVAGVLLPLAAVHLATGRPHPLVTATVAAAGWLLLRCAHRRYAHRNLAESRGLLAALHDWSLLVGLLAVLRVLGGESSPPLTSLLALLPGLILTAATGALLHRHLTAERRRAHALRRVLLVGETPGAEDVAARLAAGTDHPYVVVGVVPVGSGSPAFGVPVCGRLAADAPATEPHDGPLLLEAATRLSADLVLAVPGAHLCGERLRRVGWALQDAGLPLTVSSGLTDVAPRRLAVGGAAGLGLLHLAPPTRRGGATALKTALDRTGAGLGLLLLAPLFALVALAVRLDSRGPALYRQRRVGRHGVPFTMWKFRTMVRGAERLRPQLEESNDAHGGPLFKLRRDPRVTRVGRLLRRSSLDELPQLLNVLVGSMSLVGPRPPLPDEAAQYTPTEARRLRVRPGMTGPWQVGGRSDLSWDEGIALDLSYTDNWSLTQDLDILARTARAVTGGRGAY